MKTKDQMDTKNGIPEGYQTITPYLALKDAARFMTFLKAAFQAQEMDVSKGEDGTIYNAEIKIGTSMLMAAEGPANKASKPIMLYLYVNDPDQIYHQALESGAKSISPMTDQFYGDRVGAVVDDWGNEWWIAKRVKQVSSEQTAKFKDKKSF